VAMSSPESRAATARVRREPPRFRRVTVQAREEVSPRLVRVTLGGPELADLTVDEPAASIRLLLPPPGRRELVMPTWNGNEFLLPDGSRPPIRTFTPLRADPGRQQLDVEIVTHGTGVAAAWAAATEPGDVAAVSGPGRGYQVDGAAAGHLLAGDETGLPAIGQLLEVLPGDRPVQVHVEVTDPAARLAPGALPGHPRATVTWHDLPDGAPPGDALVAAVRGAELPDGTRVWAAGEAAAMQRIRRHLFDERGVPRAHTTVRGYWKHGRSGDAGAGAGTG
jgi:NADPH-dependent ferric siderophore reductase